jgi:hypothetical protein
MIAKHKHSVATMVTGHIELLTERLRLRTPRIDDVAVIQLIAADSHVALTTASVPHPYPEDGAKGFILHVQHPACPAGGEPGLAQSSDDPA